MLNFCDWDAFAKPSERIYEYRETVSARPAELELKFDDERLNLRLAPFASSPLGHGNFVELGLGQTAKYEWNEKIAFMHTWRYRHTVVNVALTGQHPPARLFHSQPSFEATHLVQWY